VVLAQFLGVDAASLPTEEGVGFVTLGLDSLTSIELRNNLQRTLHCVLPVTFAFDYPTMEAAAEYLSRVVLTQIEGGLSPERATPENRTDVAAAGVPDDEDTLSSALQKLATYL
jgi:acyl carrier protein